MIDYKAKLAAGLQNVEKPPISSIEEISHVYGAQAVVVSIDPKRFIISNSDDEVPVNFTRISRESSSDGTPQLCFYKCTVKGGREIRQVDVIQVSQAAEELGAGEIMLNCIDEDGQGNGYDLSLLAAVRAAVSIPVIASSGAGKPEHFVEVGEGGGFFF